MFWTNSAIERAATPTTTKISTSRSQKDPLIVCRTKTSTQRGRRIGKEWRSMRVPRGKELSTSKRLLLIDTILAILRDF